ncbi:MAG: hypothetical protein PHU46_14750 [Rhodocyclaceae bacterium]|nr:hypothetical protein [Rhodocyclaceae bacterium]
MTAGAARELDLERAQPGMVLAEPVADQKRIVLLPKGTILSEGLLAGLARRGIARVVVAPLDAGPARPSEHQQKMLRLRIEHLFRHAGDDALTRSLEAAVLDYRIGGRK